MELDITQVMSWLFQGAFTLIGVFLTRSISAMKSSIDRLNVQVGQLLVHKDYTEKAIDDLEDSLHKIETED